ncbi:MAG: hypothetical protein QXU60_07220 [Sulfolobales archaeon]
MKIVESLETAISTTHRWANMNQKGKSQKGKRRREEERKEEKMREKLLS